MPRKKNTGSNLHQIIKDHSKPVATTVADAHRIKVEAAQTFLSRTELSSTAKLIGMTMLFIRLNDKTGQLNPTDKNLAETLGLSVEGVKKARQQLIAVTGDMFKPVRTMRNTNLRGQNVYEFNPSSTGDKDDDSASKEVKKGVGEGEPAGISIPVEGNSRRVSLYPSKEGPAGITIPVGSIELNKDRTVLRPSNEGLSFLKERSDDHDDLLAFQGASASAPLRCAVGGSRGDISGDEEMNRTSPGMKDPSTYSPSPGMKDPHSQSPADLPVSLPQAASPATSVFAGTALDRAPGAPAKVAESAESAEPAPVVIRGLETPVGRVPSADGIAAVMAGLPANSPILRRKVTSWTDQEVLSFLIDAGFRAYPDAWAISGYRELVYQAQFATTGKIDGEINSAQLERELRESVGLQT